MANKQQTAVEWFAQQVLDNWNDIDAGARDIMEFLNKAKEMEKEQMIESYRSGRIDQQNNAESNYNRMSEEHYKQTYGGGDK